MTAGKIVSKLLKFKGFRAVDSWFEGPGGRDLVVAVKPHKRGVDVRNVAAEARSYGP